MQIAVGQEKYRVAGTITATQAALTTDKSADTVNALSATKTAIITAEDGSVALDIRFRGQADDADVNVLNMYAMRGDEDHYTLIATLTLTTGTQIYSAGNLFADTVVITNELWTDDIVSLSDAANGIARIALNTHGYRNFLFIATTLGSTSVIVESARE